MPPVAIVIVNHVQVKCFTLSLNSKWFPDGTSGVLPCFFQARCFLSFSSCSTCPCECNLIGTRRWARNELGCWEAVKCSPEDVDAGFDASRSIGFLEG